MLCTCAFTLILLSAGVSSAQLPQFVAPGSLAHEPEDAVERIKEAANNARWKLGALRLQPHLAVSNLGYYESEVITPRADGTVTVERIEDTRASLGAGLSAYLKLGRKVYLAGFLTPEYNWWKDNSEQRQTRVNHGVAAVGAFNRLQVFADVRTTEQETPLSSEVDLPVEATTDTATVETTLEIRPALSLSISGSQTTNEYKPLFVDSGLQTVGLDRSTDRAAVVLMFGHTDGLRIGAGVERTETTFERQTDGRSNKGTNPVLRLEFHGARAQIGVTAAKQELEFLDSDIESFEELSGSGVFSLELSPNLRATTYLGQHLVYGAFNERSTQLEDRQGLQIRYKPSERWQGSLFVEQGNLEFRETATTDGLPGESLATNRVDELTTLGASMSFSLRRDLRWSLTFSEIEYDSSLDEFDRATNRLSVSVATGGGLLPW